MKSCGIYVSYCQETDPRMNKLDFCHTTGKQKITLAIINITSAATITRNTQVLI